MRTSAGLAPLAFIFLLSGGCSNDPGRPSDGDDESTESSEPSTDNTRDGGDTNGPTQPPRTSGLRDGGGSGLRDGGPRDGEGSVTRDGGSPSASPDGGAKVPDSVFADCPPIPSGTESGTARTVTVDAARVIGNIRSLQGAHWDPGAGTGALSKHYKAMGVDQIRTHDFGGINGTGVGDIDGPGRSRIFPNMNADPNLEASYNFAPNDTMIKNIMDAGSTVFFRVGRSNISGGNTVPADFDKYAEIVKHVVMHYNKGWAKGFEHGIKYWEIWNEPDFTPFWLGTAAQYHELYAKISLAIKAADPEAIIGGPANSSFNDKMGTRGSLMKYIKDNKLPLDFYSFHKYTNKSQDPMDYARMAKSFRDELDMYGFTEAKIVNSEWETSLQGDVMLGGEAGQAAFTADALIYMQNGPVDLSHSYMRFTSATSKKNLAIQAISNLNATPRRLCAQGGDDNGFGVIAGRSPEAAELRVVIANYQISTSLMGPIPGGNEETIEIPGLGKLADMTYPERRSFTYPDKDGYALTIKSIPEAWGDVTIKQFRIDASSSLSMVSSTVSKASERTDGSVTVSGKWVRARANPPNDPKGAPQGVDYIVVTGTNAMAGAPGG